MRKLPDYTFLGCPMTKNRTPWCFRMCKIDGEGRGQCGRIAPHSIKGNIQIGIDRYKSRQKLSLIDSNIANIREHRKKICDC